MNERDIQILKTMRDILLTFNDLLTDISASLGRIENKPKASDNYYQCQSG